MNKKRERKIYLYIVHIPRIQKKKKMKEEEKEERKKEDSIAGSYINWWPLLVRGNRSLVTKSFEILLDLNFVRSERP